MSSDPRRRPPPPPPPPEPRPEHAILPAQSEMHDASGSEPVNGQQQEQQLPEATPANSVGNQEDGSYKLRFCTVCASNNNRSMEAHLRLTTAPNGPYPTISFGTGSLVRLPGPSINQPNIYHFNTTSYETMYNELASKDKRLYNANGILPMLERNKNVKWGPERWQLWEVGVPRVGKRGGAEAEAEFSQDKGYQGTEAGTVDVVITCEERCWEAVVDDLLSRGAPLNRPVHVFNVDIKDNHEEALVGGRAILELADELNACARQERESSGNTNGFDSGNASARAGFDERVPDVLAAWQDRWPNLPALWTLAWF